MISASVKIEVYSSIKVSDSGLTQGNPETRFLVDVYCLKQRFVVETGFLSVSPMAKTIIKSGIKLYSYSKATLAEIGKIVNTLVVEMKREKITAAQLVKVSVKD